MNLLVDRPPEVVEVEGVEHKLNTDFRACLRVILAYEDNELTAAEKQMIMLDNLFPQIPPGVTAALTAASTFLNGPNPPAKDDEDAGPRLYSFGHDANLIFSAFRQTHGIDLETADLHWWKFLALFMDLGQDTTFCQLVALRKRVKTGKASKEERTAAREMGEAFKVPEVDNHSLEEREAARAFFAAAKGSD